MDPKKIKEKAIMMPDLPKQKISGGIGTMGDQVVVLEQNTDEFKSDPSSEVLAHKILINSKMPLYPEKPRPFEAMHFIILMFGFASLI